MSSLGKIVYAPRGESGHANSRKVRNTWPKVIATERYLAIVNLFSNNSFIVVVMLIYVDELLHVVIIKTFIHILH